MNSNIVNKSLISGLIICILSLILVLANISDESLIEEEQMKCVQRWTPELGAEATPAAGASAFLWIGWMNISTEDSTGYGLNTTSTHETWCDAQLPNCVPNAWANSDEFDITYFDSETTFVILVKNRYNKTHAWETDHFNGGDTNTKITVTCDNWAVGSNINNVSGDRYESRNDSSEDFIWEIWVWDNGGTGYQVADDATLTTVEIYQEAKF